MRLAQIEHPGPEDQPPLLIAHGLFGSARNWGAIAKRLSAGRRVIAVDMRNHGLSPRDPANGYEDLAGDLLDMLPEGGDLLGHSMGGKAAMVAALRAPERVRRLIVADIAPVPYTHSQLPLIAAMRGLDLDTVETRGDADRQLQASVETDSVRAFLLQSLDVKERRWRLNLDALTAEMPKIMSFPEVSGSYDRPALFVTGELSDYVRPEHRTRIKELFPRARFARLPGAGHWLHAERPREFAAAVDVFLKA